MVQEELALGLGLINTAQTGTFEFSGSTYLEAAICLTSSISQLTPCSCLLLIPARSVPRFALGLALSGDPRLLGLSGHRISPNMLALDNLSHNRSRKPVATGQEPDPGPHSPPDTCMLRT